MEHGGILRVESNRRNYTKRSSADGSTKLYSGAFFD